MNSNAEFWRFCRYVVEKLGKYGPIGIIGFSVMVVFATVCFVVHDIQILIICGVFFVIALGMVVSYYIRESENQVKTAQINLQKAEAVGAAKKAKYRVASDAAAIKPPAAAPRARGGKKLSLQSEPNGDS